MLAAVLMMADSFFSFVGAISKPSNLSFGLASVEWPRDNGAAWLVSDVEAVYYSLSAPSTGGPALKALPKVGIADTGSAAYQPPPIAPPINPPLPGEGQWSGTGPLVRGAPGVLVTTFRPDPNYPQMVAGVAWIDHTRTSVWLYPGLQEPAVSMPSRGPMEVPMDMRSRAFVPSSPTKPLTRR